MRCPQPIQFRERLRRMVRIKESTRDDSCFLSLLRSGFGFTVTRPMLFDILAAYLIVIYAYLLLDSLGKLLFYFCL